jgi:aquaporin Z
MTRKLAAELLGTALLVFVGVGVATLSFGFKLDGGSTSAGVVATALAFGLALLVLVYTIGPLSGCHINPAVTLGFLMSKRMSVADAIGYWVAEFVGGILGALGLWAVFSGSPQYSRSTTGLGTTGWVATRSSRSGCSSSRRWSEGSLPRSCGSC